MNLHEPLLEKMEKISCCVCGVGGFGRRGTERVVRGAVLRENTM